MDAREILQSASSVSLRPSHIDGHDAICCGARNGPQCDDCPMKLWLAYTLADEEFKRMKTDRRSHPDAVQRAWEARTAAARNLPGVKHGA